MFKSAASCTTNAITPILAAVEETLGVVKGHLETIHAYTNDQNLVDNMHSKYRRGRGAATNMVITETGAGSAIEKRNREIILLQRKKENKRFPSCYSR